MTEFTVGQKVTVTGHAGVVRETYEGLVAVEFDNPSAANEDVNKLEFCGLPFYGASSSSTSDFRWINNGNVALVAEVPLPAYIKKTVVPAAVKTEIVNGRVTFCNEKGVNPALYIIESDSFGGIGIRLGSDDTTWFYDAKGLRAFSEIFLNLANALEETEL